MISINFFEYDNDDLIITFKYNEQFKLFSHPILDWHKMINQEFDNKLFNINYCPVTITAKGWEAEVNNSIAILEPQDFYIIST